MPNIKNMNMGQTVLSCDKLTVKKSLFGQNVIYKPTGSNVKAYRQEFDVTNGKLVEKILNTPVEKLDETIKCTKIEPAAIGNIQLEACVSSDSQFAAFMLFQFVDFKYRPISDLKYYEGDKAKLISSVI